MLETSVKMPDENVDTQDHMHRSVLIKHHHYKVGLGRLLKNQLNNHNHISGK